MDLSAAAYITLPLALLVLLSVYLNPFRNIITYRIYTTIILFIVLFLVFADIGLYQAWGFRIDATPLKYLSDPKEVWASVSHLPIFTVSIVFIMLYFVLLYFSKKLLVKYRSDLQNDNKKIISALIVLILTASFIIPLRGGFQLAPLNQSSVYFSKNNFANMAALNAPWNFLYSVSLRSNNSTNPFVFDDAVKVDSVTDILLQKNNFSEQLVNLQDTAYTNVIFIIWESLTSKAIGLEMEGKMITPGFNQLRNEGIYFSNIYATGDRTDKGIVAVLSGYPAQATTSIIKEPVKAAKLPMLSKFFKRKGYSTSFHYGGELEFANMKAYLLQGQFDQFVTINDFDKKDQNSKWGAHDGVVMERFKNDVNKAREPFFCTWLTLSSHEPYEIPDEKLLNGKDDVSKFLSSVHYTDSVVFSYIQYAKKQSWWKNTLVVIVADHGHRLPRTDHKPDDFKIPILFLGGAIKQPYKTIPSIGSQTDIATTVLTQLNMPSQAFIWSRNLLDSTRIPWAFFTFNNGFGFMQPDKKLVFDNVGKIIIEKTVNITNLDIYRGKALQQAAFQDYLDK
jgi:phosphoglycerol transferase MdoB-like AlkP superfamily enzyme